MTALRLFLLSLVLICAGCASPVIKPMGPATTSPSADEKFLTTHDGVQLPLQIWKAVTPKPKAIFVAVHGFNDYANAFYLPAPWWAKRGITTYAYDQRGFGRAPNRGFWPGSPTLKNDLRAAVQAIRFRHPKTPIHVLGVSMGGAIVMATLADGPIEGIKGAVLAAPAVWGRRHMNVFQRAALWILSNTVPGLKLTGEGLNIKPSDNIKMLRKISRDRHMIRGTRIDAIKGLVDLMDTAFDAAPKIGHTPLFIAYGLKDEIVPKDPTISVMRRLDPKHTKKALYDTAWHMLLRDLKAEIIWRDIVSWTNDRSLPLPSGADKQAIKTIAPKAAAGVISAPAHP
ncbi:MAG: alpha/beta hydrolase [Rhodospirillaceae bacterium]|nr:alpha/beta hydrolase [Rhodospirillaceae bacterium]|tara:strand:+ start:5808 stop:6833 length:1026 start_codon:yes stop_codon:yes gene_type:complete